MPLINLDPRTYATLSSTALGDKRQALRACNTAHSSMSRCYNMAGSDDGGERFAAAYDEAANSAIERAFDFADDIHMFAREFAACGNLHATSELRARGDSSMPYGFDDPGAAVDVCRASLPTSSGGDVVTVPGLDVIIDYLGSIIWPNADTDKLRSAQAAWTLLGTDFESVAREVRAWRSDLAPVVSEEKASLLAEIDDLAQVMEEFAAYVGSPTESIAAVCGDYAAQVDETREQSLIMLRDLLIEIAVGAAVSVALSFVTFGAAGAVGAGAIAVRIGIVAGKISTLLAKLVQKANLLINKLHAFLRTFNSFRRYSDFARRQTVLGRITYSSVDSMAGALVSSFSPFYQGDRGVTVLSAGIAGSFGGVFSAARFMDNFGGSVLSGGLEGIIEGTVEQGITNGTLDVDQLVKAGLVGMLGGGLTHGAGSAIDAGLTKNGAPPLPPTSGDGSPGTSDGDADIPTAPSGDVPGSTGGDGTTSVPSGDGPAIPPAAGGPDVSSGPPAGDAPPVGSDPPPVAPPVFSDAPPVDAPPVDGPPVGSDPPPVAPPVFSDAPPVDAPPVDGPPVGSDPPPVGPPLFSDALPDDLPFDGDEGSRQDRDPVQPPVFSDAPPLDGDGPAVRSDPPPVAPPVFSDAPPVAGDATPVDSDGPPVGSDPPPVAPPVFSDAPPVDGDAPPVDGVAPPVNGDGPPPVAPPVFSDAPPVDGDAPPADGDVPPADSDVPPVDGDVPPADGDVPPADGDAPPADGGVPPVEGLAPTLKYLQYEFEGVTYTTSREFPPMPPIPQHALDAGFTVDMQIRAYEMATHNMDGSTNTAMIGRYNDADPSLSYDSVAEAGGYGHFSLEDARWNQLQQDYGLSNQDMYDILNEAFLHEISLRNMEVELAPVGSDHVDIGAAANAPDPRQLRSLEQEIHYLVERGYVWDESTRTFVPPAA